MSDLIERLRGMLAKATPGPFTADRDLPVGRMPRVHCGDASLLCEVGNMGTSQDQWEANAALIAGGLTTLPELFDRIEQLEAREKKLRERLTEAEKIIREFLSDIRGQLVAGGDGGTYIVQPPSAATYNKAIVFLTEPVSKADELGGYHAD